MWGNFGIRYGPFPTQLYQLLLCLTHDPLALAALRGGICAVITAASLLWLARSANFSPWFAGALLVAPPVLHFQRLMWDASFTIPLGALALAALAAHLRRGGGKCLVTSLTSSAFLATVHPQALPLAVAIGALIFWKHRPALRRNWKPLRITLAVFLALNAVFFGQLSQLIVTRLSGAVAAGYPGGDAPHVATLAPFLGGRLLAAPPDAMPGGLAELFHKNGIALTTDAWMQLLSSLIYPLCWVGIALAGWRAWFHWKNRGAQIPGDNSVPAPAPAVRESLALVVLATVIMQGLLFAAMRVPSGAQYFFGTFAAHACLAWLAVEALPRAWMRAATTAAIGLAGAWISFHGMWITHRDGSHVEPMQPTLGTQFALVQTLNRYSAPAVFTDAPHFQQYAQGVRALRLLLPPATGKAGARLLITHVISPDGRRDEFDVRELDSAESIPASATPMDITPLPENWYPAGAGK